MSQMNSVIDTAFARVWLIGGEETPCRYRYKDSTHMLKTFDGLLARHTVCVSPDGETFEVIDSIRVNASTYQHTIQPQSPIGVEDNWER